MDNSPFSKLSRELRDHIYHLVLNLKTSVSFTYVPRSTAPASGMIPYEPKIHSYSKQKHLLALTETCKQIRAETLGHFFALNLNYLRVAVKIYKHIEQIRRFAFGSEAIGLRHWLERQNSTSVSAIRTVFLDGGEWQHHSRHVDDETIPGIARALRQMSENLRILAHPDRTVAVLLDVHFKDEETHPHKGDMHLRIDLHDRDLLRTIIARQTGRWFERHAAKRTDGLMGERDWVLKDRALRGCRERMEKLIRALLEELDGAEWVRG